VSRVTRRTRALDTLLPLVPGTPTTIVFVCTGNICRSPMAEVATRAMAEATTLVDGTNLGDRLLITSAGTGPWHEGEPMDPRARAALRRAEYPDHLHVAHQISTRALADVDLVVALDRRHERTLRGLGIDPSRLELLRSFDPSFDPSAGPSAGPSPDGATGAAADVPDPYYGDDAGFDDCLALIARGCRGLVDALAARWDAALSPSA
jgi:protein-tyrosine phosphatase